MRPATLDHPPVFHLAERDGARLTFASDTGALAHVFVLEEDVVRLMVLPDGRLRHPRTWTVAAGADDVPLQGRDRFDLAGFACPLFQVEDSDLYWHLCVILDQQRRSQNDILDIVRAELDFHKKTMLDIIPPRS